MFALSRPLGLPTHNSVPSLISRWHTTRDWVVWVGLKVYYSNFTHWLQPIYSHDVAKFAHPCGGDNTICFNKLHAAKASY